MCILCFCLYFNYLSCKLSSLTWLFLSFLCIKQKLCQKGFGRRGVKILPLCQPISGTHRSRKRLQLSINETYAWRNVKACPCHICKAVKHFSTFYDLGDGYIINYY